MTFCVFGFLWFGLVFLSRASVLNPSLVLSFPCSNVLGLISSMVLACSSSPRVDLKVTVCIYIKSAPRLLKEILERCVFLWQGCKYLATVVPTRRSYKKGLAQAHFPASPLLFFFPACTAVTVIRDIIVFQPARSETAQHGIGHSGLWK